MKDLQCEKTSKMHEMRVLQMRSACTWKWFCIPAKMAEYLKARKTTRYHILVAVAFELSMCIDVCCFYCTVTIAWKLGLHVQKIVREAKAAYQRTRPPASLAKNFPGRTLKMASAALKAAHEVAGKQMTNVFCLWRHSRKNTEKRTKKKTTKMSNAWPA